MKSIRHSLTRIILGFLLLTNFILGDETPTDSLYIPEGYLKVFEDNFSESKLNTAKWWTRYIYKNGMLATLNQERQLFRDNENHLFTGKSLQLTARKVKNEKNPYFLYESGMIRSKMTFKYGYYESRVKMPGGLGVWPAFWLNSDSDSNGKAEWPPEIDIFEFVIDGKTELPNMVHTGVINNTHKDKKSHPWKAENLYVDPDYKPGKSLSGGAYTAPFKFPDDFHTFGALWDTDDTVTIFIDGKKIVQRRYLWIHKDGREAPYAHVLLNLSIGGNWAGRNGIDDSAFPQSLEVDYVRVYQKKDQIKTGQSTIGHDLIYKPPQEEEVPAPSKANSVTED